MALALGVAAMFFGVVFIIVGWKGGGPSAMNGNLAEMMKGQYPTGSTPTVNTSKPTSKGATSTTGGSNAPGPKSPGTNA